VDLTRNFRELLASLPRALGRRLGWGSAGNGARPVPDPFWALRDLDLEVRRGEVLGIVGRNGAGKSTLLKILARITAPSAGRAQLRGRVRSLLEVGTGFHGELTGRENIYLNGAILGMRKAEIDRHFDEIVDFAELERFLDTPVKRYSSGMYVRLAFAVAAHLEAEILLVDEVLAVGDAQFQAKCLSRLQQAAGEGQTVLFVSHNMQALRRLCRGGLWIREGRLTERGEIGPVIDHYLASLPQTEVNGAIPARLHYHERPGLELLGPDGAVTGHLEPEARFTLRLWGRVNDPHERYTLNLLLRNADGALLATRVGAQEGLDPIHGRAGQELRIALHGRNLFLPGLYLADLWVLDGHGEVIDVIEGIQLPVKAPGGAASGTFPPGHVRLEGHWVVEAVAPPAPAAADDVQPIA
jgi:lipopolysaccharide transport system ATP-binding protein